MNRHHRPIWELGRSEVVTVVSKGCSIWHKNEFDNKMKRREATYTYKLYANYIAYKYSAGFFCSKQKAVTH